MRITVRTMLVCIIAIAALGAFAEAVWLPEDAGDDAVLIASRMHPRGTADYESTRMTALHCLLESMPFRIALRSSPLALVAVIASIALWRLHGTEEGRPAPATTSRQHDQAA